MTDKERIKQLEKELKEKQSQNIWLREEALFQQIINLEQKASQNGISLRMLKLNNPEKEQQPVSGKVKK
jgi:hypothetical protein